MFDAKHATTPELVAEYNRLSGKTIKKFSSRAAGEKQVTALLDKAPEALFTGKAVKEAAKTAGITADTSKAPKAKAPRVSKSKEDKVPANRSESIRRSWSVMTTNIARCARHNVEVHEEGRKAETLQGYRSTLAAFNALKLPTGTVIRFRMALKAAGKNVFEHDGKKHHFAIVSKAQGELL